MRRSVQKVEKLKRSRGREGEEKRRDTRREEGEKSGRITEWKLGQEHQKEEKSNAWL